MDEVSLAITSITSSGITLGIICVGVKFFGQGILEKLNRSWKEKQERELSELRSHLRRDEENFSNLLQIYKSSSDEIQKKRISAISDLWEFAMEMKRSQSPLSFYDIFLDSEIREPKTQEIIKEWVGELPKREEFLYKLSELSDKESRLRPFINDEAWRVYNVYRRFISRVLFQTYESIRKGENILNWKDNKETKALLGVAINKEELDHIYNLKIGSYGIILAYLEERLIIEMNKVFTGEFNLRHQKELLEQISEGLCPGCSSLNDVIDKPEFQFMRVGFT
jgi:hypothetical protein